MPTISRLQTLEIIVPCNRALAKVKSGSARSTIGRKTCHSLQGETCASTTYRQNRKNNDLRNDVDWSPEASVHKGFRTTFKLCRHLGGNVTLIYVCLLSWHLIYRLFVSGNLYAFRRQGVCLKANPPDFKKRFATNRSIFFEDLVTRNIALVLSGIFWFVPCMCLSVLSKKVLFVSSFTY